MPNHPGRQDRSDVVGGRDERLNHGRGVAVVGILHGHAHHDPCGQVACSAVCAKWVRPSFSLVIFASGSCGCIQSSLDPFFLRVRSKRASSARVGVAVRRQTNPDQ